MANFTEIGKDGIVKEGIFVRFPECVPFVGDNYESAEHKKMLVVCESNYLDESYSSQCDFQDAEKWYTSPNAKLIPKDKKTQKNFNNDVGGQPFVNIFNSVKNVLQEAKKSCHNRPLHEIAFCKAYFLRPALNATTFKFFCQPIDKQVAGEALCGIIEEIKPDLVVFASKFAGKEFKNYINKVGLKTNTEIIIVNHPTNRYGCWTKNVSEFEKALKEYWLK